MRKILFKRSLWVILLTCVVLGGVWALPQIFSSSVSLERALALVISGACVVCGFVWMWTKWDLAGTRIVIREEREEAVSSIGEPQTREIDSPVWKARVQRDAGHRRDWTH